MTLCNDNGPGVGARLSAVASHQLWSAVCPDGSPSQTAYCSRCTPLSAVAWAPGALRLPVCYKKSPAHRTPAFCIFSSLQPYLYNLSLVYPSENHPLIVFLLSDTNDGLQYCKVFFFFVVVVCLFVGKVERMGWEDHVNPYCYSGILGCSHKEAFYCFVFQILIMWKEDSIMERKKFVSFSLLLQNWSFYSSSIWLTITAILLLKSQENCYCGEVYMLSSGLRG